MSKHKHYDMIVAKAENTDLAVFYKAVHESEWKDLPRSPFPVFIETNEYFLCLPERKEACLDWLNGGSYLYSTDGAHFSKLVDCHHGGSSWSDCMNGHACLSWINPNHTLKKKPKTINVNGYTCPEPIRVKPEHQREYWYFDSWLEDGVSYTRWSDASIDNLNFNNGMCFHTEEDAQQWFKAFTSFSKQDNKQ